MAKKTKFNYFDAFESQVDIAAEEADLLIEAVENFTSAEDLRDILERAHKVEHRGDEVNHEILTSVSVDFITPIERADIIELTSNLDTVTDMIEGVMQRFYMYDVHFMHPQAIEFARIIRKSIRELRKSMGTFREFKKVKKIRAMVEDVKELEEQADVLHMQTIRSLYSEESDNAGRVEVWSKLIDRMEATVDSCELVADTMANITLKNV